MKKFDFQIVRSLSILIVGSALFGGARPAFSAQDAIESNWKACKDIPLVVDGDPSQQGAGNPGLEHAQKMPAFGLLTNWNIEDLKSEKDKREIKKFLETVANRYLQDRLHEIANLKKVKSCYSSSGKGQSGCQEIRRAISKQIHAYGPRLIHELALSYPADPGELTGMFYGSSDKYDVNQHLLEYDHFRNNPFEGLSLTPAELAQARQAADAEEAQIESEVDHQMQKIVDQHKKAGMMPLSNPDEIRIHLLAEAREDHRKQHQISYRKLMTEKAPLFLYLTPAKRRDKNKDGTDGAPFYTDTQIRDAIQKSIDGAQAEADKAKESVDPKHEVVEYDLLMGRGGKVKMYTNVDEFGRPIGDPETVDAPDLADPLPKLIHSFLGGHRDLLSYLAFTNVVEEVLQNNKQYCGIATALTRHVGYNQIREMVPTIAALMVGIPLTGGAVSLGAAGVLGVGLSAAAATTGVAVVTDIGLSISSYHHLNAVRDSFAGRLGVDPSEPGVPQSSSAVDQAENAFTTQVVGSLGLDAVSVIAARFAYIAAKEGLIGENLAGQISTMHGQGTRSELLALNKAMNAKLFGNSDAEVAQKTWVDYMKKILKSDDPQAMDGLSESARSNLIKGWEATQIARAGNDPARLAASVGTSKLMERALTHGTLNWNPKSFEGFSDTMEIFQRDLHADLLKKLPVFKRYEASPDNFSEQERRELLILARKEVDSMISSDDKVEARMKLALKKAGVEDDEQASQMAKCPFGKCAGGVCAAL